MPRRHGWLHDYHYALDQGEDRTMRGFDGAVPGESHSPDDTSEKIIITPPPVMPNITININLGDILDRVSSGRKSTKEALDEMTQPQRKNRLED